MSDAQSSQSGQRDADGAHLIEIAKIEALAIIVSEYLQHAAAVYQATVEVEGQVTNEARPYGFNSVELVQVVSTIKAQLGLLT